MARRGLLVRSQSNASLGVQASGARRGAIVLSANVGDASILNRTASVLYLQCKAIV